MITKMEHTADSIIITVSRDVVNVKGLTAADVPDGKVLVPIATSHGMQVAGTIDGIAVKGNVFLGVKPMGGKSKSKK